MHWFTADPHYGHDRIINLSHRPFADASAMNARMLAECRDRIQPDDDLWILGDFIGARTTGAQRREIRTIYHALPGRKHLVRGNHDETWVCDLPWCSIADTADILVDGRRLFMCHYPMLTWPGARRGGLQLFGHVHAGWQGSRNSINVGVDVWDYRPASLSDIERRATSLPVNVYWQSVEPRGAT